MKIIVLHGDNTVAVYQRLQTFTDVAKKRGWRIQKISDKSVSIPETLISDTLFGEKRVIVIEDYRLIDKATLSWIKKKDKDLDVTLIIFNSGTLGKTFLNSLPHVDKTEEYKLPKLIWSFLETFYPKNATNTLKLLHKITEKEPIEFVFSLLSKQIRDLYWVKVSPKTVPYPSWRLDKLKRQSQKFTLDQLIKIISEFSDTDIKTKTSQANLADLLDFIIATELE